MEQKPKRLISTQFGDILRDGFKLFTKNYSKIILPLALFSLVSIVLRVFLLADLEWLVLDLRSRLEELIESNSTNYYSGYIQTFFRFFVTIYTLIILEGAISLVFIVIGMCSVGTYLYKRYMKEDADFWIEFKKAFNVKILIPILLIGLGVPFGILFFILPAFIILGFYVFTVFTYNLDLEKGTISSARAIEKGAFWRILGIFILNSLIIIILDSFINFIMGLFWSPKLSIWLNPTTRNYPMLLLYYIINDIIMIILSPLLVCLLTALFASQKFKKEHKEAYIEPSSMKKRSGLFCPYFGYHMNRLKNFCPSCGEKLDFLKS